MWVVVTKMTRLYILSPSRSGAVPKEYFGYDAETGTIDFHKQLMVDRYKAYEFLKCLLALAYCWAHVRRDFLDAGRDDKDSVGVERRDGLPFPSADHGIGREDRDPEKVR